jgi:tRNA threonylcarbamoyladenosine biosynthesis protein TsaE
VGETITCSPEETEALAAQLAPGLRSGDVVTVSGELGSGKTTFVRGACRALGVTAPVASPTFTIGHRYRRHGAWVSPGSDRGRWAEPDVAHLDLFRFDGVDAEEWGDLEPYFEDAIVFVEWPEAGAGWLPPARATVRLRHIDPDRRAVSIERADPGV